MTTTKDKNTIALSTIAALSSGDDELLRHLLAEGGQANACDAQGRPALSLAAACGSLAATRLLLAAGADVNATSRSGESPLYLAAAGGHEELFCLLMEAGADVHVHKTNRANLYHAAATGGSPAILAALLQAGLPGLNERRHHGDTPLIIALRRDHVEQVRLMLEQGANPFLRDYHRKRMTELARSRRALELLTGAMRDICAELPRKLAFKPAAPVDAPSPCRTSVCIDDDPWSNPLAEGVYSGDAEAVRYALAHGYSPNWTLDWGEGWTVLHEAARRGFSEVARALLEAGADPNDAYYQFDETPLHMAAFHGDADTVRVLLEFGAQADAQLYGYEKRYDADDGEETPLDIAVERGHLDAVRALLQAGANFQSRNSKGYTPLLRALHGGHIDIACEIARHGAALHGVPVLLEAVRLRDAELLRRLLELGADPDVRSEQGDTALHEAIARGFEAGIDTLLSGGAAIDLANGAGEGLLHVAARRGDIGTARALLLLGVDAGQRNAEGLCAAELATRPELRELLAAAAEGQAIA